MVLPLLGAIAPFAPLIGGAIGAFGSLFAPKPKPTTQTNSIDLKKLRSDAEAAGFNPLTIIRGGGLAGYGTSTMSAAPDMRFSNALMTFGSAVSQWNYDPLGMEKGRAELALAQAQIKALGSSGSGARSNMSFETPKVVSGEPEPQTFYGPGGAWVTGPWTPAQDVEDMYGEGVGDTTGWWNYGADLLHKSLFGPRGGVKQSVSWDGVGWRRDPKGTPSLIITGGGF